MQTRHARPGSFSVLVFLWIASWNHAFADDNEQIDDIYRGFFVKPLDIETIETRYRDDIIHVGRPDTSLLSGKQTFMETNILPLAQMVNTGQIGISGKAYVVRRIIIGDMANDVGYLHVRMSMEGREPSEQLQKFSWVFVRKDNEWKVVTDFDATLAPLTVLDELKPQRTIE